VSSPPVDRRVYVAGIMSPNPGPICQLDQMLHVQYWYYGYIIVSCILISIASCDLWKCPNCLHHLWTGVYMWPVLCGRIWGPSANLIKCHMYNTGIMAIS
jgi:hypothetical protein